MRTSDLWMGLIGAGFGFGAVVMAGEGAGWWSIGPFIALALVALTVAVWRATRAPRVVLVGDPRIGPVQRLDVGLDHADYRVRECPGPAHRAEGCPVSKGLACPVADHQVAVVVYQRSSDASPVPPCERGLGVPTLQVDERADLDATLEVLARALAPA